MRCYNNWIGLVICVLVFFHFPILIFAQQGKKDLDLTDRGKKIENRIQLIISSSEYNKIKTSEGIKISIKNSIVIINGDTIDVNDIHLRGQSTLNMRRKSFEIKANQKINVFNNGKKQTFKELAAISLSMDRSYVRNRLSFEFLENLQLFKLFYAFAELRINDNSEGIYMLLEPPKEWALKSQESPLVIRRGYDHKIEKISARKSIEKSEEKRYRDNYNKIYQALHKFKGKELYDQLDMYIDINMYMRWLAFNYIVRNGDYSDEVFLYINPADNKFKVIPWDYDDIFAAVPHEGRTNQSTGDKFIFSSEDELDRTIAKDSYLQEIYILCLKEVLNELTESMIKNVLEKTYAELFPYFSDAEIIGMSRYDVYKNDDLDTLNEDLQLIYTNLLLTRRNLLKELEK